MNLHKLFDLQRVLDERILDEHSLRGHDLVQQKILALQVELAELANETRCFKYWSKKPASPRETILEEYVDALHFVFSLGLVLGYTDVQKADRERACDLTAAFLALFALISQFATSQGREAYTAVFSALLDLGEFLGLTWPEIESAYLAKNEQNHLRQAHGY